MVLCPLLLLHVSCVEVIIDIRAKGAQHVLSATDPRIDPRLVTPQFSDCHFTNPQVVSLFGHGVYCLGKAALGQRYVRALPHPPRVNAGMVIGEGGKNIR